MWNKEGMTDHFPDMDDSDWTKEYSKIIKKAVKVLNSFYYKDLYLFLNIFFYSSKQGLRQHAPKTKNGRIKADKTLCNEALDMI